MQMKGGAILYQRKYTLIQSWAIPPAGQPAAEAMPGWLVQRIQSGEVTINGIGGLSAYTQFGSRSSAPGDYVILSEEGDIDFCLASQFEERFEPVTSIAA
jgi:hypothetical protein